MEKASRDNQRKLDDLIEDNQKEMRSLNNKLIEVIKERDDLKTRLSKLAVPNLTDAKLVDIPDLSDPNRAMKVSEMFDQLHDDEWTDAFEELKMKMGGKDAIQILNFLQDCHTFCNKLKEAQIDSLNNVLLHPSQDVTKFANVHRKNVGELKQIPRISYRDEKAVRNLRRQIGVSNACIEEVKQKSQIDMSRSFREDRSDEVQEFCCICANQNDIQPASYFCFECGEFGRFLCSVCLQNHNFFVSNHDVTQIGSQSNSNCIGYESSKRKTLSKELKAKEEECNDTCKKIKHQNEMLQKLEGEVQRLKNENKMLKSEFDKAKTERDERKKVVNNLEEKLVKLNSENMKLSSEIKELHTEKVIYKEDRTKTENASKTVTSEKDALEENFDKLKAYTEKLYRDNSEKTADWVEENDKEVRQPNIRLSVVNKRRDYFEARNPDIHHRKPDIYYRKPDIHYRKPDIYYRKPDKEVIMNLHQQQQQQIYFRSDMERINSARNVTLAMQQPQQQRVSLGCDKKERVLVAAIDFGISFSGYAFSFKHDYEADPSKVSAYQNWVDGIGLVSTKVPLAVLFDENKKFHSFGYEAENTYTDLALYDEHHKWYFFKRFKMRLYDRMITRDTEIDDVKGRKMKAIDVFGAVINYLKNHLLNLLRKRSTGVDNKDIHWVLTVPAIWSDSAKQFMREAANKADIDDTQLSIALEPEAASLFCQLNPTEKILWSESATFAVTRPGTKYMVIDLGGLTVDITVYERQADGGLSELHKSSECALGGAEVDEEFYALLFRILGGSVSQTVMAKFHLDIQRELEIKKRTITPQSSGIITIRMPAEIVQTYKKEMKEDITDAIEGSQYSGKITWIGDKMRIEAHIFKQLFKSCTDGIVFHILDLIYLPDLQGINIFLMVGGFSESVMVQDAIMKVLPKGKVIIPADAGLIVLKGAVILGHRHMAKTSKV